MEYVITLFAAFGLNATNVDRDIVRVETRTFVEYTNAQNVKRFVEDETTRPAEVPAVYVIVEEVEPPTK
ncbi:MAG: hypothetical protein JNK66_02550 [Chitinophagales bacterium]|nr:hypothetical protein [Chitinophagales bacterium]